MTDVRDDLADETLRLLSLFARLGQEMRERQKAYFKSRDRGDLIASKQAEKIFDDALAETLKRFRD